MQTEIELLLVVNAAVYLSLTAGLIQRRRWSSMIGQEDLTAMFGQLELALKKRFPDLPEGFTIREGISRVRTLGLDLRWDRIESALEGYEAHRYGEEPLPSTAQPELMKLVRELRSW